MYTHTKVKDAKINPNSLFFTYKSEVGSLASWGGGLEVGKLT